MNQILALDNPLSMPLNKLKPTLKFGKEISQYLDTKFVQFCHILPLKCPSIIQTAFYKLPQCQARH